LLALHDLGCSLLQLDFGGIENEQALSMLARLVQGIGSAWETTATHFELKISECPFLFLPEEAPRDSLERQPEFLLLFRPNLRKHLSFTTLGLIQKHHQGWHHHGCSELPKTCLAQDLLSVIKAVS
jgi:hypothetical protein